MKITNTKAHFALVSKAYRRMKWAGSCVIVLIFVGYIGNELSNNINDHVAFVDADDDLIIR